MNTRLNVTRYTSTASAVILSYPAVQCGLARNTNKIKLGNEQLKLDHVYIALGCVYIQ